MTRIIQLGGVFDQQILPGLPTGCQSLLLMGPLNLGRTKLDMIEKSVGRFEILPRRKSLRQPSGWTLSQAGSHFYQTLGAAPIPQSDRRKFLMRPLGGR